MSELIILSNQELVNSETGEITNTKKVREPSWFKGIRKGFRTLSTLRLSSVECAVFFELAGRLKYGNKCLINQTEMAKTLNYSRQSIGAAIKRLCDLQIITQYDKTATMIQFKMNPAYCWIGFNRQ